MKAPLRILTDEQLEMIHRAPLTVLAETGMKLEQKAREKGLALLAKHEVPPSPVETQRELAAIVESADRELPGKS
jgi:trimethylamine:corrinoid methyltransferase-like protein